MKISRSRSYILGNRCGEGDDVVLHFRFDFVDPLNRECSAGFDFGRRIFRYDASIGKRFYNGQFDIEPPLIFVLVFPNPAHLGARITRNHCFQPGATGREIWAPIPLIAEELNGSWRALGASTPPLRGGECASSIHRPVPRTSTIAERAASVRLVM